MYFIFSKLAPHLLWLFLFIFFIQDCTEAMVNDNIHVFTLCEFPKWITIKQMKVIFIKKWSTEVENKETTHCFGIRGHSLVSPDQLFLNNL